MRFPRLTRTRALGLVAAGVATAVAFTLGVGGLGTTPAMALATPPPGITSGMLNGIFNGSGLTGTALATAEADAVASGEGIVAIAGGGVGTAAAGADAAATGVIGAGVAAFVVTNGVLKLANITSDGFICAGTGTDPMGTMTRAATGTDCGTYVQAAKSQADADQALTATGPLCDSAALTNCITLGAQWSNGAGFNLTTKGTVAGKALGFTYRGGATSSTTSVMTCSGSGNPCTGTYYVYTLPATDGNGNPATCVSFSGYGCNADGTVASGGQVPYHPDPIRKVACVVVGTTSTGAASTTVGTQVNWQEASGVIPQVACPTPPAGVTPSQLQVQETTGTTPKTITSTTIDPSAGLYPKCITSTCVLQLTKSGTDCETLAPGTCTDFTGNEDPASTPYKCNYGPYKAIALPECQVMVPRYKTQTQTSPSPSPSPTQTTGPGSGPDPSQTPAPGSLIQTDPNSKDCLGNLVTANPVTWVTGPVECAIQWAFVPDPGTLQSDGTALKDAWDQTPPEQVVAMVGGWNFQPPSSGCGGVTASLGWLPAPVRAHADGSMAFFAACPGDPLAAYAPWVKIFLDCSFVLAGALSVVRSVQGVIAYQGGVG